MSFLVAEISYKEKTATIYHRNFEICKDPWVIHSVPCPMHTGEALNTNVWAFSPSVDWNSTGRSATLTIKELGDDPRDKELLDLFNKGGQQIKIKVQFSGKARTYDLSLTLKP